MNYVYVMLGGAIGAVLRYGVAQLCSNVKLLAMPIGTIIVNLVGCFVLGMLSALAEQHTNISRNLVLMLTVGCCGAFTTFSTFSAETIKALEAGNIWQATVYVLASVIFGFLLFWAGKSLLCAN